MKSKTSCFNRTIFKKNFTHYWPLWALYLTYMIIGIPVRIFEMASNKFYYESYDEMSRMYHIVGRVLETAVEPGTIFLFAAAAALAVFSYLYSAKNANMIHALPVNRLELFVTNYLSGLSFLVVPQLLVFLISVLVCLGNQITCIQYLFSGLLIQVGLSFAAYSMAVFVAMFTGHMLAMPAYYFIINYLYVGCLYIVNSLVSLLSYGSTDEWNPGKTCILSPAYYLGNNLRIRLLYGETRDVIEGIQIYGERLVAIYAAAAVVLVAAAYQIYKRRQIETAGDFISVGIVKPIFRWGVAFCGGVLLSVAFTETLTEIHSLDVYICMLMSIIVTGFIFFFAAEMLLCKNFKVFQKKRIIEWCGFTVAAIVFITMFQVDAFGIERKLPKEDEIMLAFVNMDYPVSFEGEEIDELLKLHREVIANKKQYQAVEQKKKGYYYTTFRYYLKDGTVFERRYPVPIDKEYTEDETTPASCILAWEREVGSLKQHVLGLNYEDNEYITGYVQLYNEEKEYQDHVFSEEELEIIVSALELDIEEGNLTKYYQYSIKTEEDDSYDNCISLDYYNKNSVFYDNWDYYSNYNYKENQGEQEKVSVSRASSYITFGVECVHTVEALKELGIVNDTWRLWTVDEWKELSAK